jgi:hypothetical protein
LTCDLDYHDLDSITGATIRQHGVTVITPSIVTGRETDKKMIGDVLSNVLKSRFNGAKVVSLAEFLNRISDADLVGPYSRALTVYETSGLMPRESMRRLGEAAGVRYLAKVNLASFEQTQTERFGIAGIRVLSTNRTRIRIFLEIWDSDSGHIVWYANEELAIAADRAAEEILSIQGTAARALDEMMDILIPHNGEPSSDRDEEIICQPRDSLTTPSARRPEPREDARARGGPGGRLAPLTADRPPARLAAVNHDRAPGPSLSDSAVTGAGRRAGRV